MWFLYQNRKKSTATIVIALLNKICAMFSWWVTNIVATTLRTATQTSMRQNASCCLYCTVQCRAWPCLNNGGVVCGPNKVAWVFPNQLTEGLLISLLHRAPELPSQVLGVRTLELICRLLHIQSWNTHTHTQGHVNGENKPLGLGLMSKAFKV